MTERVYLLKQKDAGHYEKFFTSPYTAMAKAAKINRDLERSDFTPRVFRSEMFGIDIDDVPCDHVVVRDFVTGFANFVHAQTHVHGIALMEESPCVYLVKVKGITIAEVMVTYIPPDPEQPEDLGSPVLQILSQENAATVDQIREFSLLFENYSASW